MRFYGRTHDASFGTGRKFLPTYKGAMSETRSDKHLVRSLENSESNEATENLLITCKAVSGASGNDREQEKEKEGPKINPNSYCMR